MLLCIKLMGLSVTIGMRVLMILMISHPILLFLPFIWYFVGLCVTEVITLFDYDFMILQLLINISFT